MKKIINFYKYWVYEYYLSQHCLYFLPLPHGKKNEFPDSKKAISYVLRYCGRPCFAQYRIIDIDGNNFISFWYQRHENDNFVVEKIHIFEFIARLIRHIPKPQFKTIRYYGFYASKKHKLYDSCKKLINSIKLPIIKSLNRWQLFLMRTFNTNRLKCDICNNIMKYERCYNY
ncbi:MAG: transposase [Bacilli bacterium]|nr:transposase [Bacilli bacterium]